MAYYEGQSIDKYRISAELGRGAHGHIYLGVHAFLPHRVVAIKVMNDVHLHSREEQDRFRREAEFLDWLKHPHILPIFDMGVFETCSYLVTEYASRGSLRDRLQQQPGQPLTEKEALTILAQIGQALHYAHLHYVIHRDLKPENILFNAEGKVLLADFDVAWMLSTAQTEQGDVVGTPAYMAPEQFQGIVSSKSDQYALGCIAYELFTGRRPFSASGFMALGIKHLTEQPMPPSRSHPQMPLYVERAILKAMAKERLDRHADVAAFLEALLPPQQYRQVFPNKMESSWRRLDLMLQENGGPLNEEQVLIWSISLCEIMNAYHLSNPTKILGEITPDHVLVSTSGEVQLLPVRGQRFLSGIRYRETCRYLGEYSYIAPEVLRYQSGVSGEASIDPCCDIYSLGAMMYHLLTNCLPEPLRTPALGSVLTKNPSLRTISTNTGKICPSERIIIKAMEQNPKRRFQDTKAMQTALQYCLMIGKKMT